MVVAAIEISTDAAAELDVRLGFDALRNRWRLSEEVGLARGGVSGRGIAVIEVYLEVVLV